MLASPRRDGDRELGVVPHVNGRDGPTGGRHDLEDEGAALRSLDNLHRHPPLGIEFRDLGHERSLLPQHSGLMTDARADGDWAGSELLRPPGWVYPSLL